MQQSDVIVHARPGKVHSPWPPRHRETPVVAGSQPVSPPPFGQQFDVAPAPPQTSPAGTHEPLFAHRRMGRPSSVRPASRHAPEQHSPSLRQTSSSTRQPPSGWQVAVPVPIASRHAVEQHEPLNPSVPHGVPATPHAPAAAQTPTLAPPGRSQSPMQHCESAVQSSPAGRHAAEASQRQSALPSHAFPSGRAHRSVQHEPPSEHRSPIGSQPLDGLSAQVPPVQVSEQQSLGAPQLCPIEAHSPLAQTPPVHRRVQQSAAMSQPSPFARQAVAVHTLPPPRSAHERPGQHSAPFVQASPGAEHPGASIPGASARSRPPSARLASRTPPSSVPTSAEHEQPAIPAPRSEIAKVVRADVRTGDLRGYMAAWPGPFTRASPRQRPSPLLRSGEARGRGDRVRDQKSASCAPATLANVVPRNGSTTSHAGASCFSS